MNDHFKNIFKENKKYLLIFLFCFLLMVLMTLREINFFEVITNYIFKPEYRNSWWLTTDKPEIANSVSHGFFGFIQYIFKSSFFVFDSSLIAATSLFQIIIPLISVFGGITFFRNYNSIYKFSLNKNKKFRTTVYGKIMKNAFKLAISVFLAYLLIFFFLHSNINILTNATSEAESREFLLDLLSDDFYISNIKQYFLLEGFIRFFYIPLIYTMLVQAAVLIFTNFRDVFLVNIVYYYGLSTVGYALDLFIPSIAFYFNPSVIMASGSYADINSIALLGINSIPLLLSIVMIEWRCRYVEI